ncbi:MAG: glycosyltransferase [Calditrichaceae bacterium]
MDSEEKPALLNFLKQEFDLNEILMLTGPDIGAYSETTSRKLTEYRSKIDLIYFEFSDYYEVNPWFAEHFCEFLSQKGIVCIDGIDHSQKITSVLRDQLKSILEVPDFSIFARHNGTRAISSIAYQVDLFRRRYFLEKDKKRQIHSSGQFPLVTVIILTYNHERYIAECLNSVFIQRGDFQMRVIIIDDASSDQTAHVIRKFIEGRESDNLKIEFHINSSNCGVVKNLATAIRMAVGCDYLTFCEGDDFWSSTTRIQEHLDFLAANADCVMSFNTIELCSSEGNSRRIYVDQTNQPHDIIDGNYLASSNIIGNFSACFYNGALTKIIPEELFKIYTVDWLFNLYCSQFGGIGHLRKPLSVYRQHEGGEWSNRKEWEKAVTLIRLNDEYNRFLDYQYNDGFQKYKKILLEWTYQRYAEKAEKFDLIIMDDVFPSEISGFRYTEFTAYLREFPNAIALASGATLPFLGEAPLPELILKYQLRFPELGTRVMHNEGAFPLTFGRLLYVNFLSNAYALLPIAEKARVPFAFTLYPGGGFGLNDPECNRKLKRIFDSPCFMKVIVTQQITYDYLIAQNLCPSEKMDLIFGVVMPQDAFVDPVPKDKPRWGFQKKRLDICFMAHRYTPHGEDKGYDLFIDAALRLCKIHNDIYFHVVGPYDEKIIDVSSIQDRIQFYGILHPQQLDDFFIDMDIIMSPNISDKIWPGSFDGFPTASCTESGLRGVAIFCTDEFNSADGKFVDGQDFVFIKYDVAHIVQKVEYYYRHPTELKAIGECGSQKILDLYSYESQIASRVRILRELIDSPFVFDFAKWRDLEKCLPESTNNLLNTISSPTPSPLWKWLRKHSPESLKIIYQKFIKRFVNVKYV